jgi:hypothetical protein
VESDYFRGGLAALLVLGGATPVLLRLQETDDDVAELVCRWPT